MQKSTLFLICLLIIITTSTTAQVVARFEVDKAPALYCAGEKVSFINKSSGQTLQKWDFADGNETYFDSPEHIYEQSGTYTVSLTAYDDNGNFNSFTLSIEIIAMPGLNLEPRGDNEIEFGQGLTANVSGTFTNIKWDNESEEETRTLTLAGTYVVTVTNDAGCSVSDSITITVTQPQEQLTENFEIFVMNNILTPNADGYNDFLFIENLGDYSHPCNITIFNAYGSLVFSSDDYQNNWNGDQNGKNLPSGTYYYIITSEERKGGSGYIDILRQ